MTGQIAEGAIPGGKAAFLYQRIEDNAFHLQENLKKNVDTLRHSELETALQCSGQKSPKQN